MFHIRNLIGAVVLISFGPLANSTAIAQPRTPAHAERTLDTLKTAYLQCERGAVSGKLATADIMLCSVIYEELKQRAFNGDFKRLKAWADKYLPKAEGDLTRSKL